ncbi:MAG: hypothetical protein RQ735_01385 [Flavobacteriaceae bacterium]|nr:hypothetical protein [Bacteroidota bacterium]MDT8414003.1 hypothetical protein [Flavobacteriaceae bacterium]
MSELSQLVVDVDNKLNKLIIKQQQLLIENKQLRNDLAIYKRQISEQASEVEALQKQIESLRIASTISGSDAFKHETKNKINTLVREIDNCIIQLSK